MTPATCAALCTLAGLTVLSAEVVGRQVCVTISKVPQSASGLAALTARLGCGVTFSLGSGAGNVRVYFAAEPGQ